jgi:hypothetical protein
MSPPIAAVNGAPVRGKKWTLPLTYGPKIPGVIGGTIRQTIRPGRKYVVGDWVAFHGWKGLPCRSRWSFQTGPFLLHEVRDIIIFKGGIKVLAVDGHDTGRSPASWWSSAMDELAQRDGIIPPTGIALGILLNQMYRIPEEGLPGQIIRW